MDSFLVINTVKKVGTRLSRQQSPSRHRFTMPIMNNTVRLGHRPVRISSQQVEKYEKELARLSAEGKIEVRKGGIDGPIHQFGMGKPVQKGEEEQEIKENKKPIDRMNKSELLDHVSDIVDMPRAKLKDLTKKELLELVQ
jgi:hypothetical protein